MSRVLLLSSLFTPNIGGVENSINALAQEYISLGYEVNVVCSNRNHIDDRPLPMKELRNGINIYRYAYPEGVVGYMKQFANCIDVIRCHNLFDCDVILARSPAPVLSAFWAGGRNIKYLVPSVYLFQERAISFFSPKKLFSTLLNSLVQFMAFLIAKNLVFSVTMVEQVKKASLWVKSAELVRPGVNTERFKPISYSQRTKCRGTLGIYPHQKVILGLGRFSEIKQFDHVIECMKYLKEDVVLFLVGDGPERAWYEELINALNLKDKVRVFPSTTMPEFYYKVADVFVMTSRYEAFGQVLLEATSCGIPVVAYAKSKSVNTSVDFIYKYYPSLVFYANEVDAKSLASAILDAIDTFDVERSSEEYFCFLDHYSWRKLALDIVEA